METAIDFPKKKELIETLRRNHVIFAAIFGSRAKGTARPDSDYDILVEFDPNAVVGYFKLFRIEEKVKQILGPNVDFVTMGGLHHLMRDEVFKTMKVLYDRRKKR